MTALRDAASQRWQGLPSWCRSQAVHAAVAVTIALGLLVSFGAVVQGVVHANESAHTPPAAARTMDASLTASPGVDRV